MSHLQLTPKSVGAAITAIVGMIVAFNWLNADEAMAVTAVLTALAAILIPERPNGKNRYKSKNTTGEKRD